MKGKEMDKLEGKALWGYVAGIIDGEGCIYLSNRHNGYKDHRSMELHVKVGMANEWVINFLLMQFGGVKSIRKHHQIIRYKQIYEWAANGKKAGKFLKLVLPYLQIKRPQAELGIAFQCRRKGTGYKSTPQERLADANDRILMGVYNH